MIHIVCLRDERRTGERLRVGAVRYPPRGKRKEEIDEYDVRLPELAPSSELLRKGQSGSISWDQFARRYRSEMKKPERKYLIPLFAALSKDGDGNYVATFAGASPGITGLGRRTSWQSCIDHCPKVTDLSVGCYCQDETRCHRSVLRELLADAGAELA